MLAYVSMHQPKKPLPKEILIGTHLQKFLMNPLRPCTPLVVVLATYPLVHLNIRQTPRPLPRPQTPLLKPPTLCRTTPTTIPIDMANSYLPTS